MMTHCPVHYSRVIQERASVCQVNELSENSVPMSIVYQHRLVVVERYVNRRELKGYLFKGKH